MKIKLGGLLKPLENVRNVTTFGGHGDLESQIETDWRQRRK